MKGLCGFIMLVTTCLMQHMARHQACLQDVSTQNVTCKQGTQWLQAFSMQPTQFVLCLAPLQLGCQYQDVHDCVSLSRLNLYLLTG